MMSNRNGPPIRAGESFRMLIFTGMIAVLGTGCATFNREWQNATARPAVDGIEGRWAGSWRSEATGHSGRLRCVVTSLDPNWHQAWFHASYWGIFRFGHKVLLRAERSDGMYYFQGTARMRWWAGGYYLYEGQATSTNFTARYHSKSDHGVFEMSRP